MERKNGCLKAFSGHSSIFGEIQMLQDGFHKVPRISEGSNVLEILEKETSQCPELYSLALVALAVLAMQVGVERSFLGFKYILSCQRTRLSLDIPDDVLFLRFFHAAKAERTHQ
ncbi:hypothetical protein IscW_ISCW011550 [Ixodes scapularis]|uniref:HAT C-terminal dimerisation domain-containing protein n=1 Tax=Ixodes scapularis TaxID=6945 RepID=B7Q762_IXOSC|nr:hypothetical protein IscW_ISCW011550 [Ixodes scapularis]|eukprot:XP_002412113.1 hypothetical protein IscW_ISCW011550 [Ixodes scapularis]